MVRPHRRSRTRRRQRRVRAHAQHVAMLPRMRTKNGICPKRELASKPIGLVRHGFRDLNHPRRSTSIFSMPQFHSEPTANIGLKTVDARHGGEAERCGLWRSLIMDMMFIQEELMKSTSPRGGICNKAAAAAIMRLSHVRKAGRQYVCRYRTGGIVCSLLFSAMVRCLMVYTSLEKDWYLAAPRGLDILGLG